MLVCTDVFSGEHSEILASHDTSDSIIRVPTHELNQGMTFCEGGYHRGLTPNRVIEAPTPVDGVILR